MPFQNDAPTNSTQSQTTDSTQTPYQPPIQIRDPQGKTKPEYRMGIGQRILGTLANFANGFARTGAEPVYVGPGALNNRYYQDEQEREQQNQENTMMQRAANRYRGAIDWRTIGKDPATGKWRGKTYGGEMQEIGTPPWVVPEQDEQQQNDDAQPMQPPVGMEPGPARMSGRPRSAARERFAEMRRRRGY